MAKQREQHSDGSATGTGKERRSTEGRAREKPAGKSTGAQAPRRPSPSWREPRGVEKGIADPDKAARTGSTDEPVRNTPPAGAWNDTSRD